MRYEKLGPTVCAKNSGQLQDYWSRKAKDRGILTEEDLERYLES